MKILYDQPEPIRPSPLKKYLYLALLAHFLFFLSFSLQWVFEPAQHFEKQSDRELPVYLQEEASSPQKASPPTPVMARPTPPELEKHDPDSIALKKQKIQVAPITPSMPLNPSRNAPAFLEAESTQTGKPIDQPLLRELSRATAAKLYYPPKAAAFRITGMVIIRFLLYPDGRVTEVAVAKSSGFRVLDEAAFKTIQAISPVRDANLYLNKPRWLFAGILFG